MPASGQGPKAVVEGAAVAAVGGERLLQVLVRVLDGRGAARVVERVRAGDEKAIALKDAI